MNKMCHAHFSMSKIQWEFTFIMNNSHGAKTLDSGQC